MNICPNHNTCKLVNSDVVVPDPEKKQFYVDEFCLNEDNWPSCKRYVTKRALWFCPDWLLPDANMTEDEIIERCETKN